MAYTSNKKPGGLDAAVSLAGTNNIVVDQAGTVVRASLNQVEAKVFDAKTQVTPNNGDVVVVRRGNDIRQVVVENMLPAGSVTNAMLGGSIADSKLNTIDTAGKVTNQAVQAVSTNTANRIVTRDGSGNFAAGTITATLSGNATTATTATTANQVANTLTRGQYLVGSNYNGSVARTWDVDGTVAATANKVAVRDGSGALTATSFLGNATSATTAATATTVVDGAITDAKVTTDANQRIAGSKITPNFGTQALTAGNISGTALTTSGSISSNNATITGQTECRRAIGSGGWALLARNTAGSNDSGIFIDSGGNPSFEGRNGLGVLNTSIKSSGDSYIRGGNFGVGTNSPSQRIHVVGGDIRIDRTVDNMASGIDGAVSFGGTTEYIYGNRVNKALALGTNGANRLIVDNSGITITGNITASGTITGNIITSLPAGFPIQIVQSVKTDVQTITNGAGNNDWVDVVGLGGILNRLSNLFAQGKVRIQASIVCSSNDVNNTLAFRIQRDIGQGRVTIGVGAADGNRAQATASGTYAPPYTGSSVSIDFIDTPGDVQTIGYQIQARIYSPRIGYINRGGTDTNAADYTYRCISTLTLTEIR